jgi:hypothetical protein
MTTTRKTTPKATQDQEAAALAAAEANVQAQDPQVQPEGMTAAEWALAISAADADDQVAAQVAAQEALAQAQDEVLATVHPINGGESDEAKAARHQALEVKHADQEAQAAAEQALTGPQPTRATWRQHGQPLSGWQFFGTAVKVPNAKGIKIVKVEIDPQGITLKTSAGREAARFGSATKLWALVPAEAPRKVEEPKAPKTERTVAEGRTSAADRLAAALTGDSAHQPAPEGYEIRWPKGGYDLLKRTPQAPEGSPAWLVRCNLHQTTTPSTGGKAGDALGTKAGRLEWCSGCQADAKAEAKAEAKAQAQAARDQAKAEAAQAAEAAPQAPAEEATSPQA